MRPIVRAAVGADAGALADLSRQLGYSSTARESRGRLARLAGDPDHAVFVAEWEGKAAGWLHVQRRVGVESPVYAEIVGLVIDEARRGAGLGAALVRAAETWARGRRLRILRVRTNVVRERTHAFYLKRGFTAVKTQTVFQKRP